MDLTVGELLVPVVEELPHISISGQGAESSHHCLDDRGEEDCGGCCIQHWLCICSLNSPQFLVLATINYFLCPPVQRPFVLSLPENRSSEFYQSWNRHSRSWSGEDDKGSNSFYPDSPYFIHPHIQRIHGKRQWKYY